MSYGSKYVFAVSRIEPAEMRYTTPVPLLKDKPEGQQWPCHRRIPGGSRFISLLAFLAGVLVPVVARAQAQVAEFHRDPVDEYGSRFLTIVILIGIAIVLYSLIRYRGRVAGPLSWGLLIVGVGIIPALTSGFGTVLVFERAEHVSFCLSCHLTMQPFVEDMRNPKSDSLAALHYKNRYIPDDQCYVCHTSYGMFGTVKAKQSGMMDVYKYFTRTYHKPIKLREPYPNTDCLKCHADSVKWQSDHADYKQAIFAGQMKCLDCHGMDHPAHNVPK
jgi:cytochrome c nitrite reductase small subunit